MSKKMETLSFGEFCYQNSLFTDSMDNKFMHEAIDMRMHERFPDPAKRMEEFILRSVAEDGYEEVLRCQLNKIEISNAAFSKLQNHFNRRHQILRDMKNNAASLSRKSVDHIHKYEQFFPLDKNYKIEKPNLSTYAMNMFSDKGREFNRAANDITGGPAGHIKRWINYPLVKNSVIDPSP